MLISPSKKSLTEILNTGVNLQMLKDLMTLDVVHPFTSEEDRLRESSMQIDSLIEKLEEQGRYLGNILIEKGLVDEPQWDAILKEMAETQTPLSTLLINHRLVEPNAMADLVEELKVEIENHQRIGSSLKEILLAEKLIDEEGLNKALDHSREKGIRFSQAIVSMGLVPFEKLADVFLRHYNIESVDLNGLQIEFAVVNLVPDNLMKTHEVLPIRKKGKKLTLAMSDPRNRSVIKKIEMMTSLEVIPNLADRRELLKRLEEFIVIPDTGAERLRAATGDGESFRQLLESDSAVKMVNRIIEGALNTHATDIHVEPQEKGLRIRYRIDGMLYDIMTIPRDMGIPTVSRIKVLAGMDVTERRRPQDGHVNYEFEGKRYNMRAATLPTHLGEKIVLRVLDESTVHLGLNSLGFSEKDLVVVRELIHRPHGMLLVTGPIGSGKTTTLYSALSEVNQQNRNIVTLEDPVEFHLPGVNQVQVDPKIGITFASGLRAILRQDANILMVGEIRDSETAQTAVRAANTGHLLMCSMHTNNAVSAITALQHLGIVPFQIATSLQGIIAQRLVRTLCPDCKRQIKPKTLAREMLGLSTKDKIFEAVGCNTCFGTGYRGRTGIQEVLKVSDRIQEAIVHGASEMEIEKIAFEEGMTPLARSGAEKVIAGLTSFEELSRVIVLQQETKA